MRHSHASGEPPRKPRRALSARERLLDDIVGTLVVADDRRYAMPEGAIARAVEALDLLFRESHVIVRPRAHPIPLSALPDELPQLVRHVVLAERHLATPVVVLDGEVVPEPVRPGGRPLRARRRLRALHDLRQLARLLLGELRRVELPELRCQAGVAAASCQLNAQ